MSRKINFIPISQNKNLKPLELPECVHLSERLKCMALCVNECRGESCSFRQTNGDRQVSQEKWNQRMNSLSTEKQTKIAADYYGGTVQWNASGRVRKGRVFKNVQG